MKLYGKITREFTIPDHSNNGMSWTNLKGKILEIGIQYRDTAGKIFYYFNSPYNKPHHILNQYCISEDDIELINIDSHIDNTEF